MSEEQTPVEPSVEETPAQPVSWVNEDGSFNSERFGDLGGHSIFEKYQNIEELVKGTINANKMIGQKVDDWIGSDNEDIIKQRLQLSGVPSDPSEYEIRYPDSFADLGEEERSVLSEYLSESAKWAQENGVPKELFEKFAERDLNNTLQKHFEQVQEQKAAYQKAVDSLKSEWRNDFDNNVKKAESAAKTLGMEAIIPVLHDDPGLMKAFHDGATRLMSDDVIIDGAARQSLSTVKDEMADLGTRMMDYRGSTNDPEYQRMVEKMGNLQRSLPKTETDFPILG